MQWNFWIRAQISTSPRRHARTVLAINYDKSHVRSGLLALLRSTLRCIRAKLPPLSQLRRRLVSRISMLIVMGDLTSSVCAFHFPDTRCRGTRTSTDVWMTRGGKNARACAKKVAPFYSPQSWKAEETESTWQSARLFHRVWDRIVTNFIYNFSIRIHAVAFAFRFVDRT